MEFYRYTMLSLLPFFFCLFLSAVFFLQLRQHVNMMTSVLLSCLHVRCLVAPISHLSFDYTYNFVYECNLTYITITMHYTEVTYVCHCTHINVTWMQVRFRMKDEDKEERWAIFYQGTFYNVFVMHKMTTHKNQTSSLRFAGIIKYVGNQINIIDLLQTCEQNDCLPNVQRASQSSALYVFVSDTAIIWSNGFMRFIHDLRISVNLCCVCTHMLAILNLDTIHW